jgi:hypothetical protein
MNVPAMAPKAIRKMNVLCCASTEQLTRSVKGSLDRFAANGIEPLTSHDLRRTARTTGVSWA